MENLTLEDLATTMHTLAALAQDASPGDQVALTAAYLILAKTDDALRAKEAAQ